MLGIGIGEMILIAGIALVVFGPEKFPDFAKIALRTVRDLRGYMDDIQKEISKEIKPIKRELDQMSRYDPEKYIDALSKDISGSTKTTSSNSSPSKSAADPTDRQDDSFDYSYNESSNHPDQHDPYGNSKDAPDGDKAPEASNAQEDGPPSEPEQSSDASKNSDDDLDFSKEPVERLD